MVVNLTLAPRTAASRALHVLTCTQTLPRETNYHASLQRLTFNPLPELAFLRQARRPCADVA